MQSLGSKESLGVNFKDGICASCIYSSGMKTTGVFVILLSQDGFESDCPDRKIQIITS